MILATFLSDKV